MDVDQLIPGVYDFTINVLGGNEGSIQDEVIVTVTNEIPTLISSGGFNISVGILGATINWTVSDISVLNPTYSIYVNGTLNTTGVWVSGDLISIDIENLTVGIYNIKIIVYDGYGGIAQDEVILFVEKDTFKIPGYPKYLLIGIAFISISILSNQKKKIVNKSRIY